MNFRRVFSRNIAVVALCLVACGDDDGGPGVDGGVTDTGGADTFRGDDAAVDGGAVEIFEELPTASIGCCNSEVGLGLSPSGEPRMVGMNRDRDLWFGVRTAGTWVDEEVATDPSQAHTAFVVGSDDSPHILYVISGADGRQLQYVRREGAGWTTQRVGDMGEVSFEFSHFDIALDASNQPHVVFLDSSTGSLMYAGWNGAAFDLSVVDTPAVDDEVGEFARLAVGSDGSVHVSYSATIGGELTMRYAVGPATWTVTDVAGMAKGIHGTILLNAAGDAHVLSAGLSPRGLPAGVYWSRLVGGTWTEVEVRGGVGVADMDAALDPDGNPHVFVSESRVGNFGPWVLYRYDGAAFSAFERPPPVIPPGGFDPGPIPFPKSVSIAVDGSGQPHMGIPNGYLHF